MREKMKQKLNTNLNSLKTTNKWPLSLWAVTMGGEGLRSELLTWAQFFKYDYSCCYGLFVKKNFMLLNFVLNYVYEFLTRWRALCF